MLREAAGRAGPSDPPTTPFRTVHRGPAAARRSRVDRYFHANQARCDPETRASRFLTGWPPVWPHEPTSAVAPAVLSSPAASRSPVAAGVVERSARLGYGPSLINDRVDWSRRGDSSLNPSLPDGWGTVGGRRPAWQFVSSAISSIWVRQPARITPDADFCATDQDISSTSQAVECAVSVRGRHPHALHKRSHQATSRGASCLK